MDRIIRRCSQYTCCSIAGASYLLPYGQKIADHSRGLQINDTAAFLWELLKQEHTFEELLHLFAVHYQADESELPELEADLRAALHKFRIHGLLEFPGFHHRMKAPEPDTDDLYLQIAGLILRLCGPEKPSLHPFFRRFLLPQPEVSDQTVVFVSGAPLLHQNGKVLIRNEELTVMELPACYILLFPSSPGILEARLEKDGSLVTFFCRTFYDGPLGEELFHGIRLAFLYLAQRRGILALHSASLFYRDRAWLFSGPSGTGKSTHTNLWNQLFLTPLLNGDLNLLAVQDGIPMVYGLPWCGTSEICTPQTCILGGILLLKQASENRIEFLSADRRRLLTAQRLISPSWTKEQFDTNLRILDGLEPLALICRLHCTPEPEAAFTARQAIDAYLDTGS